MAWRESEIITAPEVEPVTIDEVMLQTSVGREEVAAIEHLTSLIAAARDEAQSRTGRALITQTRRRTLDQFGASIELDSHPVQSVEWVKYLRVSDGVEQTLDPSQYVLSAWSTRAEIVPAYGVTWPATRAIPGAVRVQFVCGYGATPEDVPSAIRQWIKVRVSHLFANTEQVIAGGVVSPNPGIDALLALHVVHRI